MKRITFARLAVLMLAVAGLALQGCGGDDNGGLSASDMARIDAAEAAATDAQAEIEALEDELADLQAQRDEMPAQDDGEDDTSDLDEAIAALQEQINMLLDRTDPPDTPLEILGGTKSTASVNDRAALARAIAGELNGRHDHDGDMGMANLPDISAAGDDSNAMTRDVTHASQLAGGGFLKDAGIGVDLSSPGDIATLRLSNLLTVDGVSLMSFSLRETDKVNVITDTAVVAGTADGSYPALASTSTRTTTLGADGSMSVMDVNNLGQTVFGITTSYVGGTKIVEANPLVTSLAPTGLLLLLLQVLPKLQVMMPPKLRWRMAIP